MDFIKSLLGEHQSTLVSSLVAKTGLNVDQAQAFVPAATDQVVEAVKGADDIDLSSVDSATRTVMDRVDVGALAGKTGIDKQQAQNGLGALVPQLLQLLQEKAGGASGLMSMLGNLGKGGASGMLGGLGKMIGKD